MLRLLVSDFNHYSSEANFASSLTKLYYKNRACFNCIILQQIPINIELKRKESHYIKLSQFICTNKQAN